MTIGPVYIAETLAFYCYFLTVESAEALSHSRRLLDEGPDCRETKELVASATPVSEALNTFRTVGIISR